MAGRGWRATFGCVQDLLLAELREDYWHMDVWIELRLAACKENTLPTVPSLWPRLTLLNKPSVTFCTENALDGTGQGKLWRKWGSWT